MDDQSDDHGNYHPYLLKLAKLYEQGSQHWVRVTHVNNPQSFYVRLTKYNRMISYLESYNPTEKIKHVYMQQQVRFQLKSPSVRYIRGKIINSYCCGDEITCDIYALDYGFIRKSISFNNIWKSCIEDRRITPLALHCQLTHCLPLGDGEWSDDAVEAMKYYFGDERVKMTIIDNLENKIVVEMTNTSSDDIATLLALSGYSSLGYDLNMVRRIPAILTAKDYYNFKKMTVNETLLVRMLHGVSMETFYVVEVNDYLKYLNNQEMVTHNTLKEKGFVIEDLLIDFPVCVLDDDGKSERAIVKSIILSKSEAVVQLVDTGKEVTAHTVNMRYVPKECLSYPPLAIFCSATLHQHIDTRLYKFLQPGYQFFITIKELGHQLEFPNIVTIKLLDEL